MARLRLVLMVLLAGLLSLAAGLGANWLAQIMPCEGEGLACNIDAAIGASAAMIWAVAGGLLFLMGLLIKNSRKTLAIALALLLAPLVLFVLVTQSEHASTIGFEPYRQLRTVLVMIVPPVVTALVQYVILRNVTSPKLFDAAK